MLRTCVRVRRIFQGKCSHQALFETRDSCYLASASHLFHLYQWDDAFPAQPISGVCQRFQALFSLPLSPNCLYAVLRQQDASMDRTAKKNEKCSGMTGVKRIGIPILPAESAVGPREEIVMQEQCTEISSLFRIKGGASRIDKRANNFLQPPAIS
jgi:hypothetical protein